MLRAEGLAAFRGERLVFRDLGFSVPSGGALVLTGPNGSGKSTLLRVLAGLGRLAAGQLSWQGADALDDPTRHARRVSYIGHLDAVKLGFTVEENLRFTLGRPSGDVGGALETMGLMALADLPARMLSAGQKRRLALSRLALSAAPLWLLDEPTLGLDTSAIVRFGDLLSGHRSNGGIVVAATHVSLPVSDVAELRLG